MAETNLLVLAREFKKLRDEVKNVLQMPKGDKGDQGEKGDKGDKGDIGPQGFPGRDGKDGINGYDGKDGRDGVDGKDGKDGVDGVGVANAYIDFDNSLVIVLTNGNEVNAGYLSQETKDAVIANFKQGAQTISELLPSQEGNAGKFLTTDGTNISWATVSAGGSSTVTSVALSAPTGFTVSGSPVTTTGTLGLSFDTGYSLPTTSKQGQWDTAYSWGNHASAGYLDSADIGVTVQGYSAVLANTTASFTTADETKLDGIQAGAEVNVNADWNATSGDAQILNKPTLATVATTGAYSDLTGKPTIPSKTSDLTNDSGFITGYTETDPVVGAVNGLVKANGAGTISAAVAGTDYLAPSAIGTTVQAYDADLTAWAALSTSAKQDTLVSGTNIKTVNSTTLLGSGDLALFGGGLTKIEKVSSLPGSPDANTLYIVV